MTQIEMQYMEAVKSIARSLNKPKEIDWEQRRYETARDLLIHNDISIDNAIETAGRFIAEFRKRQ